MKLLFEITVLASSVKESLSLVKSKLLLERSAATIVPSKMLVELMTPVPTKALVKVRVEMLAESKTTVEPLKESVKEELLMMVLASKTKESLNSVKLSESALMDEPVMAKLPAEVIRPSPSTVKVPILAVSP